MKALQFISLLLCLSIFTLVVADDLGTHGRIYPIVEKDYMKVLQSRAQKEVESGQWAQRVDKWKKIAISKSNRPEGIILPRAQATTSHLFDPSTITPNDIRDTSGRLIHPAGTKVNPLSFIAMTKQLLFIDGDDKEQVDWMVAATNETPEQFKIILTNGPVIDLMTELNRRLYFDQKQALVNKLAINKLPALVYQEGLYLRIDEMAIQ